MDRKTVTKIVAMIIVAVLIGVLWMIVPEKRPVSQTAPQNALPADDSGTNTSSTDNADDISSMRFTYESDGFTLTKRVASSGIDVYEYGVGDMPERRVYTFVPNDATVRAQGIIGGVDTRAFILWRGSGANIIEPILFVFREKSGAWQQLAYTKLPPDDGRTTIDDFSIKDDTIVLDVKTSGPNRNYHETYVPKRYVYGLDGDRLVLE